MKKKQVVSQRSNLQGLKKASELLLLRSMTGITITTPDCAYGIVKSTYNDLSAVIVVSPTTASNFC